MRSGIELEYDDSNLMRTPPMMEIAESLFNQVNNMRYQLRGVGYINPQNLRLTCEALCSTVEVAMAQQKLERDMANRPNYLLDVETR